LYSKEKIKKDIIDHLYGESRVDISSFNMDVSGDEITLLNPMFIAGIDDATRKNKKNNQKLTWCLEA
jgi:hypothetical protein